MWKSKRLIFSCATMISVGILTSVSAQTQSKKALPSFTTVKNPAEFKIQSDRQPFLPAKLRESEKPGEDRAIIGSDNRVPMTSRKYPWSAVGKIEGVGDDGNSYSCTGTLISEDIVLTNAHCVVNPETGKVSKAIAFLPNLVNGVIRDKNDVAYATNVYYGTDFPHKESLEDFVNDWAIVKLDKPIGKKYGYLGWQSLPSSSLVGDTQRFALVGYSGDFPNPKKEGYEAFSAGESNTAGVHLGCSILRQKDNLLYHNCDTTGGASGGAIISKIDGKYYVLALHSGWNQVNGLVLNRAVEMSRLDEWLQRNK